jgi:oligosaccharide repeat unit polymerase
MRESYPISNMALIVFMGYTLFAYDTGSGDLNTALNIDNNHYALLLTLAILVYPLEKVLKGGLRRLIETDVLLVSSFIYWSLLDILQSRYPLTMVEPESVKLTFIYIALFVLFVEIGAQYSFKLPKLVQEAVKVDISSKNLFTIFLACFFIGIFYFFYASYFDFWYMISALDRPRFNAPWSRGAFGGFSAIIEHLKYFGYLLPTLFVLIALKEGKMNAKVLIALVLTIFFSAFEFQGGGRRITGFLIGVGAITYMVYKRNELGVRHYLIMTILAAGMLVLLDMQLAFRNKGYENMFSTYDVEQLDEVRVDDNFLRIAQMIELIPESHPYGGFKYYIYSLGRPIPRFFWPGKPLDPGFVVNEMVGEMGVSLTTTVVGEAYASMGVINIIFMAFMYGLIAGSVRQMVYYKMGILGFTIYALQTLAIVGGVRALVDMVIFSYAFLGLMVMYKFWIRKKAVFIDTQHA